MVAQSSKELDNTEEDLWGSVLQNFRKGVSVHEEKGTLIVLGDINAGKSALLARAKGEDIPSLKRGIGLTYDYISVYEDNMDEPSGNVDIWVLEGEALHRDLLKTNLSEESLANAMVLICLDLTHPWLLEESLNRWLEFLHKAFADILSETTEKRLQAKLASHIQHYHEPEEVTTQRRKKRVPTVINDETSSDLGQITHNLGVPIAIVCCKSDMAMLLEKDYDMKTHIFDYIQLYLRKICFSYGASLFYTSAKKDINTETLMDYIEHRLFGFEFTLRADLSETDTVFVPAGWDNSTKIQSDLKALQVDLDEPFDSVVQKPAHVAKRNVAAPISAEDDVAFMMKHKAMLEREQPEEDYVVPKMPFSLLTPYTTPTKDPVHPSDSSVTSPVRARVPDALSQLPSGNKPRSSETTSFISPSAKDKHVLATFFDALMKSKDGKRSDPTSPLGRGPARQDVDKEIERLRNAMKK